MIMPRGYGQLLLPARPWFIAATLLAALAFELLPLGRAPAMPDLLAVVLVFWNVHQPRRVGLGVSFALGLCMDVNDGALLGLHALTYTVLAFGAIAVHRRLLWFAPREQALQVLPVFAGAALVTLVLRQWVDGAWPSAWLLLAPVLQAALWPVATWALLAPQRRAPDRDEHRPL